ncbi:MAG: hypothetical protein NC489_41495 [Ruminococcus flavefaciens]|nr:hypothetical protein [Ruminococcus flavefaciens]
MKKLVIITNAIYIYFIAFLLIATFSHNGILEFLWEKVFFNNVYIPLFLIIQLGILNYIINIVFIIMARKGKWDARELASVNMFVKLIQIPGYLYIFVMGIACLATIFSMGISIALVFLDCFCIGMTGLLSVAAFYGMEKEGRLSRTKQIVCTIGSFIFCVDVVLAVVGYRRSRA